MQILINSKGLQMNPIQSLYYVSPACLICLSIPFGESFAFRFQTTLPALVQEVPIRMFSKVWHRVVSEDV